MSMDTRLNRWGIQGLIALAFAAACLAVFTNFVPLIQMGWIAELGKKSRYVRLTIIALSVFSVLLIAVRLKSKALFDSTLPVHLWRRICSWPIGFTSALFFLVYATLTTFVGFERHHALETRAFDLGIFAQAVWNTLQGDFLFSSIKENICLLGDHVSPILLLTVPFYKIWSDPRLLVLLQSVAAAASFFPLAIIAEKKLQSRSLTVVFLFMYFFFHSTRSALHEDFHPEVLAEHFLWWAFLFIEEKKIIAFILCLLIAACGKENFLGITFMFGFYAFTWKRMRILGIFVMFASVGALVWEMKWLIPYLTHQTSSYATFYSQTLANPIADAFVKLFNTESLEYVVRIYLPFIYLPFFHIPTLFLTFPILFQNLLSSSSGMRSFNYHYTTGMTPFLFVSTLYALDALRHKSVRFNQHLPRIGFVLLFMAVLRGGPSEYYFFWHIHSHRTAHTEMIREKLRHIPQDAVVLTHNNLIPQLCNRKHIYQFDYSPVNSKLDFAKKYQADYIIGDSTFWERETLPVEQTLRSLKTGGYQTEFSQDGFFIMKKASNF